jgi:protein KRI1
LFFLTEEEAQNAAARAQKLKRDKTESTNRKKPMNLRDYHRKALLTNEGREFDEDEPLPENYEPTPVEEAEALRDETKRAFHGLVDDEDDEDNESAKSSDSIQDMLVLRDKEIEEIEEEDQEYQRFLIEQVGNDDIQTALQLNFGTTNDASEQTEEKRQAQQDDDEFLRAYVLGRGWIDKEAKKIPKYKELVEPGGHSKQTKSNLSGSNASVLGKTAICDEYDEEDEEFVEKAEEFETNYNFRFEE